MRGHWDTIRRHPSAVLLIAQLVAVLAYPFLGGSVGGRAVVGVVQLGVVLAAVAAVRLTPALTWFAVLLGGPAMVLTVLEAVRPDADAIVLASAVFHVPFYFYISYAMLKYLFHDDRVTRDELFATGAAFTVVAWGFAYVYAACQVIWPGSFIGHVDLEPGAGTGDRGWFELLYLSFSTLTSVGLSDVVPVGGHARSLVMVEMVAGVFYVALVVARLVSLAVVRQRPTS
ncbi:ion channel [Nocardioides pyridinolyticus]